LRGGLGEHLSVPGPAGYFAISVRLFLMDGSRAVSDHQRRINADEQARRLVELWKERPKSHRTADDVLTFYGWLSEHEPKLVPGERGESGSYERLRTILTAHVLEPK
jgi:hypothetical protein